MKRSKENNFLALFLGVILAGCAIQAGSVLKGNRIVFPGLTEILRAFGHLLVSSKTWKMILTTTCHLMMSLLLATTVGVSFGLVQGLIPFARILLKPTMILLRSFPMIVLTIILMVLTEYRNVPVLATSLVLIPILGEATAEGISRLDPELIDAYRLDGKLSPYVLFKVHLPLVGGYLSQAYINSVGMGIKVVVTTEYLVQTKNSLGKAVFTSNYMNEYQDIYAYALIMILMVLLIGEVPKMICKIFKRNADDAA